MSQSFTKIGEKITSSLSMTCSNLASTLGCSSFALKMLSDLVFLDLRSRVLGPQSRELDSGSRVLVKKYA